MLSRCNAGGGGRNRACSFRLADIDDRMNTYYTQCAGGNGDIQSAWDRDIDERRCAGGGFSVSMHLFMRCCYMHAMVISLQPQGVCQFSPPLGDVEARAPAPGYPVAGSQRLDSGGTVITASAAITVDSTSIVYVGYTNSSGNYFLGAERISLAIHILYVTYNTLYIPSSHHVYHIFTSPRKCILYKHYVICCETTTMANWTRLHICTSVSVW